MKLTFLIFLSLATASYAKDPDAQPMKDVPFWATYTARHECCDGVMTQMESIGMFQAFKQVNTDGSWMYWSFGIPLGTQVTSVTLETTQGIFHSDKVFFVKPAMTFEMVKCPGVATEECQLWDVNGEQRVVAFAHFPVEPKGDLIRWDIEP